MQEAIRRAGVGGYEYKDGDKTLAWESILLDPLFWQSLGKIEEWNMTDKFRNGDIVSDQYWEYIEDSFAKRITVFEDTPIYFWLKCICWINEGKPIDDYFNLILKK